MNPWIEDHDSDAQRRALQLAKGSYQAALRTGGEAYSASTYRGHYKRSRDALFARLDEAGIPYRIDRRAHGRLVIVLGAP